jgi:hypothetical protein
LLDPEVLPEHREVAQSLRQIPSRSLGVSGHQCHLLMRVDPVDRGHQLHTVFDLYARYKTIISQHECKRAILFVGACQK